MHSISPRDKELAVYFHQTVYKLFRTKFKLYCQVFSRIKIPMHRDIYFALFQSEKSMIILKIVI